MIRNEIAAKVRVTYADGRSETWDDFHMQVISFMTDEDIDEAIPRGVGEYLRARNQKGTCEVLEWHHL